MSLNSILAIMVTAVEGGKEYTDSISTALKAKESALSSMTFDEIIAKIVSGAIDLGIRILIAVIVFYIGKLVINKIYSIVKSIMLKHKLDKSLSTFVLSLVKITLLFILIVSVIGILGIETSSFIAIFASAGVAIGMALSGTLQNFAGGVLILFIKPYKIGDFIEFGGYQGTVKEIQIFNTVLNTVDNKSIIIPNGGLSTGTINNYSKEEYRRLEWNISISYGDDMDVARKTALDIIKSEPRIVEKYREDDKLKWETSNNGKIGNDTDDKNDEDTTDNSNNKSHKSFFKKISKSKSKIKKDIEEKKKQAQEKEIEYLRPKVDCSPTVALSSLADSSIVVTIRAWTRSEFYWPVYYSINEKIYKEFPKNGLNFPFPQMDIHVTHN